MQFYLVSEQIAIKMKRPVFARKLSRVDQIFRDKIRLVFRNVFQGVERNFEICQICADPCS